MNIHHLKKFEVHPSRHVKVGEETDHILSESSIQVKYCSPVWGIRVFTKAITKAQPWAAILHSIGIFFFFSWMISLEENTRLGIITDLFVVFTSVKKWVFCLILKLETFWNLPSDDNFRESRFGCPGFEKTNPNLDDTQNQRICVLQGSPSHSVRN